MLWSFLIEVVETWLTWQRSIQMLSQSLKIRPSKYRMLVGMVDVIFSDVAQPDQVYSSLPCMFHVQFIL